MRACLYVAIFCGALANTARAEPVAAERAAPPPSPPQSEGRIEIVPDPREPWPKQIAVNAAKSVGRIDLRLGTNCGPATFPGAGSAVLTNPVDSSAIFSPDSRPLSEDLVDSYRRLGIEIIRTHDFYGPTDWYTIFPRWQSDPDDPASYDFASSDARIRPIAENGFQCMYRLGTSWKGKQTKPINDPPGTLRGPDGNVTHVADRADFQKWAKICVQIVRHYTQGWNAGFQFNIAYWEIWNEPNYAREFWSGTPEQYYMLYEEAAKAIKQLNPKLKVGGPAAAGGGVAKAYLEQFLSYCRDNRAPLDFYSWHSYGRAKNFHPYTFYQDGVHVREALDKYGFANTESFVTEWNAGIGKRLINETPYGPAFMASALACQLDAGVRRTFQYRGDRQLHLGLHEFKTGEAKTCAYTLLAWKQLMETPERIEAGGSDQRGYNIVAGKSSDGRRVQVLISDFRSGYSSFRLRLSSLPWDASTPVVIKRRLLDSEHKLDVVEETAGRGREITIQRPMHAGTVCLISLEPQPAQK